MQDLGKVAAVVCLMFAGCADQPGDSGSATQETNGKSGDGITVEWPGGSFTMDEEEGVKVRARGVEVDVEGQRTNVRVPEVDVDVNNGERVDFDAPDVSVRADKSSADVQVGEKDG